MGQLGVGEADMLSGLGSVGWAQWVGLSGLGSVGWAKRVEREILQPLSNPEGF